MVRLRVSAVKRGFQRCILVELIYSDSKSCSSRDLGASCPGRGTWLVVETRIGVGK